MSDDTTVNPISTSPPLTCDADPGVRDRGCCNAARSGSRSRLLAQNEKAAAERAAAERAAVERDMDTEPEGCGHRARGASTHRARPEDDFTIGLRRSSERRARAPVDVALTGLNGACRGAAACGVVLCIRVCGSTVCDGISFFISSISFGAISSISFGDLLLTEPTGCLIKR